MNEFLFSRHLMLHMSYVSHTWPKKTKIRIHYEKLRNNYLLARKHRLGYYFNSIFALIIWYNMYYNISSLLKL